ncbi:hypothetical protein DYB26_004478, partial [Aphanomyces astaci]
AKYSTDGYAGDALEQRLATVKRLEQDFTRKFLDECIVESLPALRVQAKAFLFNSLAPILQQVIRSYLKYTEDISAETLLHPQRSDQPDQNGDSSLRTQTLSRLAKVT